MQTRDGEITGTEQIAHLIREVAALRREVRKCGTCFATEWCDRQMPTARACPGERGCVTKTRWAVLPDESSVLPLEP